MMKMMMKNKKIGMMKNKNAMTQMKALFLIMNMVFAVVAISYSIGMVSGVETTTDAGGDYVSVYEGETLLGYRLKDKPDSTLIDYNTYKRRVGNPQPLHTPNPATYADITKGYKTDQLLEVGGEEYTVKTNKEGRKVMVPKGNEGLDEAVDIPIGAEGSVGTSLAAAFTDNLVENALWAVGAGFAVRTIAGMFGATENTQNALFASVSVGLMTQKVVAQYLTKEGTKGLFPGELLGKEGIGAGTAGLIIGVVIFAMMYKKTDAKTVEFNCLPYQPPIGGGDCELCNEIDGGCSEYRCKSLGQACDLVNKGTEDEKCVWINPLDVNSPTLEMIDVLDGYKWMEDTTIRPPATGVVINQKNEPEIEPFTALEFTIRTNEPAQCKIDYNLTTGFEEMSYYIGGTSVFSENHTETMSLPSPESINAVSPELKNDGTYTLYVRCRDANGNFNQDAYSVRFKVKEGPDTTPPRIVDLNIPSKSPVGFNQSELNLEVYLNEHSECKWSREDKDYSLMENSMSCNTNVWEMNNRNVYTCRTTLTSIQSKQDNDYYFRCKDQPGANESDRNVHTQSSLYTIIGTQPLSILEVRPEEDDLIKGSSTTVPIFLEIKTDNGYNNGESFCFFTEEEGIGGRGDEDEFIEFSETNANLHKQRLDLGSGTHTYYFKCVDLGGNTVYDSTTFETESDSTGPKVVRAYKESGQLRIITDEESICAYSNKDCNFDIDEGVSMASVDDKAHATDWLINKNFYIRCKDEFENEPNIQPGDAGCSIIVRPYEIDVISGVNVL